MTCEHGVRPLRKAECTLFVWAADWVGLVVGVWYPGSKWPANVDGGIHHRGIRVTFPLDFPFHTRGRSPQVTLENHSLRCLTVSAHAPAHVLWQLVHGRELRWLEELCAGNGGEREVVDHERDPSALFDLFQIHVTLPTPRPPSSLLFGAHH
jgi:hypothetical protein